LRTYSKNQFVILIQKPTKMSLPSWDLTIFYSSYRDPKIKTDLELVKTKVAEFVAKYRTRIQSLNATELLECIVLLENLIIEINKPSYYLHLLYEAGGPDVDEIGRIQSQIDEETTLIGNEITFFDTELAGRKDLIELAKTKELEKYHYFLEQASETAKYVLSEEVEKVLSLKSLTSNQAWSKFFTDQKAKIEVELTIDGETKKYNITGLQDLLKSPEREIRKLAFEAMCGEWQKREENTLEAYNNILFDKKINDSLRGYKNAEESKLISNQVSQSFVDSLVRTAKDKVSLVERYYKMKNEILELKDAQWYDSYAEIPGGTDEEKKYSWEECQQIIIKTFTEFNPRFGEIATEAFAKNWLDAQPRERKYGGAFMSNFATGYHPVILCNYKFKFSDVSTVAHEMGHLIHSILTEEKQTTFNSNYPLSMAEIASLCCETVVFDKLFNEIEDKRLKLKLICEKVEEEALNIYIGGVGRYIFEKKMHEMYLTNGTISAETIREIWVQEHYKNIFGSAFNFPEGCQYTWQSVAHFTYIFYNYVYASGLLTSNAIYEIVKNDEAKKSIYLEILSMGGCESPTTMLGKLGLDIESVDFWQIGFKVFEDKLIMAENLWAELKNH
jgi:oligoendopeptidase F